MPNASPESDSVDPRPPDRGARRYLGAVAGLTLLAAALRLATLNGASVWFDEAVTLALVRMDLGEMLAQIPRGESTPPLYYLAAWIWARLAGIGDAPVRALSALAGIATVPVLYAAGMQLANRRAGLAMAALSAVSPLLVWHSQDARAYSLLLLVCAVSLLTFARALEEPRRGRLAAWATAAAVALLTHYFAVFLVAGEALWLLARRGVRPRIGLAIAAPVLTGLALVPLALAQRAHGGASWLAERALGARAGNLWPHFLGGYGAAPGPLASYESGSPPGLILAATVLVAGALILAALAAASSARRSRTGSGEGKEDRTGRAIGIAAGLALVAVGAPLLLALAGLDYVFTRNLLPAWIALGLLVALGVSARRTALVGVPVGIALCGVLAAVTLTAAASPRFGPDSWDSVASGVGGPRASRVVLAPASIAMPLALARPGLATLPAAGARVPEIVVLRRGGTARRSPAHGFVLVERRVVGDSFTLFRFRSRRGPALVTPRGLLGDLPVRRRRTAALLAPPVQELGAARDRPPAISFCAPPPGDARARISIRTPCSAAYPTGS